MKQHEAVIEVMRQNGGYATLGHLYQTVLKVPNVVWNTKTPFKSINRIVQTHNEFFKIRPGLWALTEYKDWLPKALLLEPTSANPEAIEFNHSYYQGLLVEIGNIKKCDTFVPAQDRNKIYVHNKPLHEITSLKDIPQFTYPVILRRARTIDVLWFNDSIDLVAQIESKDYIFEVEVFEDTSGLTAWMAMLKLMEYRYLHQKYDAKLVLVFDRKLSDSRIEYMENREKIYILWEHNNELHASPKTREELAFLWQ